MRITKFLPVLAIFIFAVSFDTSAQCKAFAKKTVLPGLGSYTHDGNYHAAVLVEGEEAELYKTFYSDMEYRVSVAGDEKIPSVEFTVVDADRNVLFTNRNKDTGTWDFKLESSQQLRLIVKVPSAGKSTEAPASGCVAIMFGFKIDK